MLFLFESSILHSVFCMNNHILPTYSLDLLCEISSNPHFADFYLAGGTALSLQLGHRISIDLDFFSESEFSANLVDQLKKPYEVISLHNNSIELILDNTKIFFFRFSFPLVNKIKTRV